MSKLVQKLEQATNPPPRRLGFAASRDETKAPSMVTIVRSEAANSKLVKGGSDAFDSAMFTLGNGSAAGLAKLKDEVTWGLQPGKVDLAELESLKEAGCDYLVFGIEDTPGAVFNEEGIGKVLSVDTTLEEQYMRVLEDTPTDAIFITSEPEAEVTIKGLMAYRSVIAYVSKAVLVRASLDTSESNLRALQNLGVAGLVVEVQSAADVKKVSKLKEAIAALPPRQPEEREGPNTIIARTTLGQSPSESIPDEDD